MNSVMLVGTLITDPEVSYTGKGKQITKCRIKVPRGDYSDEFEITSFGKAAEAIVVGGFASGQLVGIKGELQSSSYEKDGKTYARVQIVAWNVELLN